MDPNTLYQDFKQFMASTGRDAKYKCFKEGAAGIDCKICGCKVKLMWEKIFDSHCEDDTHKKEKKT